MTDVALAELVVDAARILGPAALSGAVAAGAAVGYRWYARDRIPRRLAVLIGLSAVAAWLNTLVALRQYLDPATDPFDASAALVTVTTFVVAGVAAGGGRYLGDRLARESSVLAGSRSVEGDVSPLVRAVGRVIALELPVTINDVEGYDPVREELRESLAGTTMLFPRGLTVAELEERLAARLREDYDVGRVDVDLSADGRVEYLALGRRAAGVGPTLPPGHVAVALRADPAPEASPGDAVELWIDDPPERVARGELRGVTEGVATVAVREDDAGLDRERPYRIVTRSAARRPDRTFATLLRTADETVGISTVQAGSVLVGRDVGSIGATVAAIRTADGDLEALPAPTRSLAAGETIHVIGRPEALRRLESRASTEAV
ncbi:potassium transporter TrkA [Halalkalicoccus ordinarius]|uniref:potassium transporter TrkA n=1 Tax=Halalkalicoccus ordinarius TaxID=3116651 RepID=UPI00300ED8C5